MSPPRQPSKSTSWPSTPNGDKKTNWERWSDMFKISVDDMWSLCVKNRTIPLEKADWKDQNTAPLQYIIEWLDTLWATTSSKTAVETLEAAITGQLLIFDSTDTNKYSNGITKQLTTLKYLLKRARAEGVIDSVKEKRLIKAIIDKWKHKGLRPAGFLILKN